MKNWLRQRLKLILERVGSRIDFQISGGLINLDFQPYVIASFLRTILREAQRVGF